MVHQGESELGSGPGANAAPRAEPEALRFGPYTLVEKLATGGMAEIWLATQRGLAGFVRLVVIKKILAHLGEQPGFVDMFLDEARTCAQLTHPNIVQTYDLGREAGAYFIAMEYIAGEDLSAITWRARVTGQPVPPGIAARIMAETCRALHYAHRLRGPDGRPLEIVHRDVSPHNVLVTYEGEVKVVDFGIAKAATRSEQTRPGILKGKFSYMSPEQCTGAAVDARSDVFALGIVLYELCTGQRLFKHESELMILDMVVKRPIPPPSDFCPWIPEALEAIIMRALERPLERRFQSAQAMQLALEDLLRAEPGPLTSADIAAYMRALFADRIEERRRVCARAVRGASRTAAPFSRIPAEASAEGAALDVGAGAGEAGQGPHTWDDPTTEATLVAVEAESRPDSVAPASPPGLAAAPGSTPASRRLAPSASGPVPSRRPGRSPADPTPAPMTAHASWPSYARALAGARPGRWWLLHVAVASLSALLVGAIAVLTARPATVPAPIQRGRVSVDSLPVGAEVYVDGLPLQDASGAIRRTPAWIDGFEYGTAHRIRLALPGTLGEEQAFVMDDATDGREYRLTLRPEPGLVQVTVLDAEGPEVEIFLGGESAGRGPVLERSRFPGPVSVAARAQGRTCVAEPAALTVRANETVTAIVRCSPAEPRAARPAQHRRDVRPVAREHRGRSGLAADCTSRPELAPGFLTINAKPYADIYIGGKRIGQTPLARHPLPSGCARLRAVSPETGRERTFQIEIRPGATAIYDVDL